MNTFFSRTCLLAFLILSGLPAGAGPSDFADSLFDEGDYLNAAHEYKRLLFLNRNAPGSDFIAFRVAAAYQNAGQWDAAIRAYRSVIDSYPQSVLVSRAENNIAQCYLLAGSREKGRAALETFLTAHEASDLAPRVHFTIGMLHADKGEWTAAHRRWNTLSLTYPDSPFAPLSDRLTQRIAQLDTLPRRSPSVAATLSALLPGSGQVYSGTPRDGFYTFLGTLALAGASVYYAEQDRFEVAVPVGTLGIFLYGNGIYQSIQTARQFNVQQAARFRTQLQQEIRESGVFVDTPPPASEARRNRYQHRF